MKLLTVGDSFTWGEELEDRSNAWPHVLGKLIDYKVTNLGMPSRSNTYMARRVVEHAQAHDLIVIAWSHFARMEFADDLGIFDIWPGSSDQSFRHEDISHRKELIDYVTRYHSDEYLYRQYLTTILLTQAYLKQNNKRYIMLDAFGNNKHRNLNFDIVNQVDPTYYIGWPNETMMEWTWPKKVAEGPNGHFLDEGHVVVANKIYEYIRNLSWVS